MDRLREELSEQLIRIASAAGDVIWGHYSGGRRATSKQDGSPVTAADLAGEAVILSGLREIAPHIPVVAEEEVAGGRIPAVGDRFFLVDPLDGTKEFISGGTDFTVNIGLIEHGKPTLGVVYAPALGALYWGDAEQGMAVRCAREPHALRRGNSERISIRPRGASLRAVASKSHNTSETEAWLKAAGVDDRVSIGSSLKFVLVARGEADVYPRPAPTMEWDTAAGDAILRAAGGGTFDMSGKALTYGKEKFFNPGFLAAGSVDASAYPSFQATA